MSDLDLNEFLKEASVADLDWLDVDEEAYREMDVLPKQNLDIRPDLEALWAREGESPSAYFVPNVQVSKPLGLDNPNTIGDMSQVHGDLSRVVEEIRKIARLAVMETTDPVAIRSALTKHFDLETLRQNRLVLAEVLEERGLLGKFYVNAADFPHCEKGRGADFVRKHASTAKFLKAKDECGECSHATSNVTGGTNCAVFNKEIRVEVPFTDGMADLVERQQTARGHAVTASEAPAKDRIRNAYLATAVSEASGYKGAGLSHAAPVRVDNAQEKLVEASSLLKKKNAATQAALDAQPVIQFLNREMVKGLTHKEVASGLRLAFDESLLKRTYQHWGPVLQESGLYGVVYTKQASFQDCAVGADFLAKHNSGVRAVVAGDKCGSCVYNKGMCLMYGKPLVKNASEIVTNQTVESVLLEHRTAGRLQSWDARTASNWGETPAKALKAIHEATRNTPVAHVASVRMGFMEGFHGHLVDTHKTSSLVRRDIAKQASKYMNEGLYGQDLLHALRSKYEVRDLVAAKAELRTVLAEQGLQGIYYVDPAVYDDYGRGCAEASRLHRTRLVGYLKEGSKCDSCVHQIKKGFCSQINKPLVVEPPYVDKIAQQREVLASGSSTEISVASIVNNGASMMAEYELQNPRELAVDINSVDPVLETQIGRGKVTF